MALKDYIFHQRIGFRRPSGQGLRPDLGRHPRRLHRQRRQARPSPTTAMPTRGWAARRWPPPTRSSSPAKAAASAPLHAASTASTRSSTARPSTEIARERRARHRLRPGRLLASTAPTSRCCCTASRPTSPWASTPRRRGGNLGEQEGAGDQGLMFGFACRDSEEYEKGSFMPAPIYFSHRILEVSEQGPPLGRAARPAARRQEPGHRCATSTARPVGATKVVVSTQHNAKPPRKGKKYNSGMVKEMIAGHVAKSLPKGWMPKKAADFFVNPTGNFVVGGPDGDCGLTGRKIIVDTYGGYAPARRRRLLRQGPDQGRPLGGLCRALSRQERGGGRPRRPLPDPGRLRDRRRRSDVALCRHPGHRQGRRAQAREDPVRRSSRCARPTSAARCSSTSRSTSAPRPTAISAASPTRTAASPGSAPIWWPS